MIISKITSTNYRKQNFQKNENYTNSIKTNSNITNLSPNMVDTISFGSVIEKPVINAASDVFSSILSRRNLTPHILCGGLRDLSQELLRNNRLASRLKTEGNIDTIIDLRTSSEIGQVGRIIEQNGINYFHFDIKSISDWFTYVSKERPIGHRYYPKLKEFLKTIGYDDNIAMDGWGQSFGIIEHKPGIEPQDYEQLKKFLEILGSDDNVLMGCAEGKERTSLALLINHFFNKKQPPHEATIKCYNNANNFDVYANTVEKIYKYLSPGQIAELGIADRYKDYEISNWLRAMKIIGCNNHGWDIYY